MTFKGIHFALGALLLTSVLFLALSIGSLIVNIRSQYRTGLNEGLCKCELFRGNQSRSIQARIVNGTVFTSRRGLPWVASIYYHGLLPIDRGNPSSKEFNEANESNETNETIEFASMCTGSILSSRFVLTASHCIQGFFYQPAPLSGLWVAAGGNHDLNGLFCRKFNRGFDGKLLCDYQEAFNYTKKVVKLHMHPQFSSKTPVFTSARDQGFDIALLEVQPFTLSKELNILPACLFESGSYSFGDRLLAAGYGMTQPIPLPNRQLSVKQSRAIKERSNGNETIKIFNPDTKLYTTQFSQTGCEVAMNESERAEFNLTGYFPKERISLVCATSNWASACSGDSGGPLMYSSGGMKQFIVGVSSSIYEVNETGLICNPGSIGIYTWVYPHLDWIRHLMGDERCITTSFQFEPEKLWVNLLAGAQSILIIALVAYFIVCELKRSRQVALEAEGRRSSGRNQSKKRIDIANLKLRE